jgi:carbon monoxide dehydrogenase subunit G
MDLTNDFRVALPVERAWAVLTDVERIAPCLPGAQLQEIEGDEYRGIVKVKVGPITAQYKGKATFVSQDAENHVAVLRAEGRETRGQGNANATITATLTPDAGGTSVSVVTDLTVTGRVAQFGRGVLADVSARLLDQFVDNLEKTVLVDEPTVAPVEAVEVELEDPIEAVQPDAGDSAPAAAVLDQDPIPPPPQPKKAKPKPAKVPDAKMAVAEPEPTPAPDAPIVTPVPSAAASPKSGVRKIDSPEPEPVDLLGAAGSPVARRVGPVLAVIAIAWLLKKLLSRSKD